MTDGLSKFDMLRALKEQARRIGQTEVKEVPLTDIGCRVYNSANISIANNTSASPTFDSERYDSDDMHSLVTNPGRITFTRAGKHLVIAHMQFASNATGIRQTIIRLNGTTNLAAVTTNAVNGGATDLNVSTVYDFAINDFVDVVVYQNSGGALNISAAANYSPEFSAQRLL